jgi:hypothetical protein
MPANINDAEADSEAEAEAAFATNIQEAGEGDHEQLQGWSADAERVCRQPLLILEQESLIQVDGTEESRPEVGQHLEEQKEQLQAAPAVGEQGCVHDPGVGEWAGTTDVGCMNDHSSQSQLHDEHLSVDEELRRALLGEWPESSDEEDWSESGYEGMPFANNLAPPPQSINSWSGKRKQVSQLDNDNWTTPFAPADGEMPGCFTDDEWFGKGQWSNHGQPLDDDGNSAGWFSEKQWFHDQRSKSLGAESDCWMTPLDELIGRTTPQVIAASDASSAPSPTGPAVCIWNAGPASEAGGESSQANGAAEIFTDGQQVFQPVPSATGQPLFTDGKQLYASVCVVVVPPGEAVDPILATACRAAMCGPRAANLSSSPGSV